MFRSRRAVRGAALLGACTIALVAGQAPAQVHIFDRMPADDPISQTVQTVDKTACEKLAPQAPGVQQTGKIVPATGLVREHCQVEGVFPTGIRFLVKLPFQSNGRLYMQGGAGMGGQPLDSQPFKEAVDRALSRGFMTVRSNSGHDEAIDPGASWALDQDKLLNYAYQSNHATVSYAKKLAWAFYGAGPKFSYYDGCSGGGREGIMSANRFPDDFDGISANAPALFMSELMIKGLWNQKALSVAGMTPAKFQTTFNEVLRQCDKLDGLKDGLIDNPSACHVNLSKIRTCKAGSNADQCLSPDQKDALEKIYAGPPHRPDSPLSFPQFPGIEHPSTIRWYLLGDNGQPSIMALYGQTWSQHVVFKDPSYDPNTFDFVKDPGKFQKTAPFFNPEPDLTGFAANGGKLITWYGLSDVATNPQMAIEFYDDIVKTQGVEKAQSFYRMFLIPGVSHCTGGYGPDQIDPLTPLINWVEKGEAPQRLAASSADGKYNRAYCPYPANTVYNGKGNTEDPANFHCEQRQK